MWSAYGRPLSADSWARRILDAAIIDMALVILAVFSTLRIRRRICLTLGIYRLSPGPYTNSF